ncbi:SgcJ/EcaC family oxidoreductase [Cytophaga sp. FL35]|uniref:SgcJ/EcaC family oxidoreductase n=1 Tax=Cytophaga sp. FL35 TaxID=1904456 RepID=UPI0016536F2A|nr:SgcJ/EcaC family oxidoreductase [Cytophaga sp. FL35]MBC6999341.1 SgcJ/EcaC family oxidoreductase [Cytophaga sp. FL35]
MKLCEATYCLHTSIIILFLTLPIQAQTPQEKPLYDLIAAYAHARDHQDTLLLGNILTDDIDQLVSTGEWRRGRKTAQQGMLQSSNANPGDRILEVEQVRFLNNSVAIIDARYEIRNPNGNVRNMWSTFIAVLEDENWKISAIRNMLPRTGN